MVHCQTRRMSLLWFFGRVEPFKLEQNSPSCGGVIWHFANSETKLPSCRMHWKIKWSLDSSAEKPVMWRSNLTSCRTLRPNFSAVGCIARESDLLILAQIYKASNLGQGPNRWTYLLSNNNSKWRAK